MSARRSLTLIAAAALLVPTAALRAAQDTQSILAGAPIDLSLTVYRAPSRESGSMSLEDLQGFALVRETRMVKLPAGLSRVRFEGVADGIEPVSAILTGLTEGVVEKNLDAQLLSPATLLAAAAGRPVTLARSNPRTGRIERLPASILTGPDADGVVFQTSAGIEALRCSGLPEAFTFSGVSGLSATPTLSVLVRAARPIARQVTLSYLARGFDWAADYTATLSPNGETLDLGAWVTLGNANPVGFPDAHTQVVAGRVNHENNQVEPIDVGGPVLARCWPQGSTSDAVWVLQVGRAVPLGFEAQARERFMASPMAAATLEEVAVSGNRVSQEQLGDLKLYRVPHRTTVASLESKQVRLLDRDSIPVRRVYGAELRDWDIEDAADSPWSPASVLLRTRNNAANHLGLPLPSGRVAVFGWHQGTQLLLNEADMRDLAVDEEVEIALGTSSDVQVRARSESVTIDPARVRKIPLVPGVVSIREAQVDDARVVEVSNARASKIDFELMLLLEDGARVVRADHALGMKNGHPIFRLTIPAHRTARVRYQTELEETEPTRD
jgi:hypothetical protein